MDRRTKVHLVCPWILPVEDAEVVAQPSILAVAQRRVVPGPAHLCSLIVPQLVTRIPCPREVVRKHQKDL